MIWVVSSKWGEDGLTVLLVSAESGFLSMTFGTRPASIGRGEDREINAVSHHCVKHGLACGCFQAFMFLTPAACLAIQPAPGPVAIAALHYILCSAKPQSGTTCGECWRFVAKSPLQAMSLGSTW